MNLREELLKVRDANDGVLTPKILKEAARPKNHPLHAKIFDRPAKEAAEKYFTMRARELIRSVKIRYPTIDKADKREVRAFLAVRTNTEHFSVYDPTEEIADDPMRRAMVLRQLEHEWNALRSRAAGISEFFDMIRRDLGEDAA